MSKVELLAPAGNYESFIGAIHAGADAVYLGGSKFGARAYAQNFTDEEIIKALQYAHLHHRKIYMVINTLLRDREVEELYSYLLPFYEQGLDGVIVQDLGVMDYLKETFPKLELHASTQMTISGVEGAKLLKNLGATRIVPARELSIKEITAIKTEVDIEVETFIHGAMCYAYSGQCLFSSMLGGRSGNRGKCAQPCRLPYEVNGENVCEGMCEKKTSATMEKKKFSQGYYLSLKDMCTIEMIPELIKAGIDSFKIEGRMKKPEYAAGVTALYRKYIDRYMDDPNITYKVEKNDLEMMKKLYIRNELSDGYYRKHNGKEMVTVSDPSYMGSDAALLEMLRKKYIDTTMPLFVNGSISLHKNEPMELTIYNDSTSVTVKGTIVEASINRPMDEESIKKQLLKTGNTFYAFEYLEIQMDNDIFVPLKELNELRRTGIEAMDKAIQDTLSERKYEGIGEVENGYKEVKQVEEITAGEIIDTGVNKGIDYSLNSSSKENKDTGFSVGVETFEQLKAVLSSGYMDMVKRIDIATDCFLTGGEKEVVQYIEKVKKISVNCSASLYLMLPHILRRKDEKKLSLFVHELKEGTLFKGVIIRNLDTFQWILDQDIKCDRILDSNVYVWNRRAKVFWEKRVTGMIAPFELSVHDLSRLGMEHMELPIYGRIPLMCTANCVKKTCGVSNQGEVRLKDRYQKEFPIRTNCNYCYNIIYNSVPLSLHQQKEEIDQLRPNALRIHFTFEGERDVVSVMEYYTGIFRGNMLTNKFPWGEFTNGHFKRGAK